MYEYENNIDFDINICNQGCNWHSSVNGLSIFTYIIPVECTVFSVATRTVEAINFLQPVRVIISGNILKLKMTIFEKTMDFYLGSESKIINKHPKEAFIINSFESFMRNNNCLVTKLDINKGIKYLWANDFIDSRYVKFRKPKSVSTEAMDEDFTVKTQYPEKYQEIIDKPIERTVFQFHNAEAYMRHFTTEPSLGKVVFSIFPQNLESYENTLNFILQNNS
jgi:hypothetical protein